jgi:RNA dependent RNA polymerase
LTVDPNYAALNSPKKRKLDKTPAERANNFLDRLRVSPTRPYEYGILPFAVDWQVCRLDSYWSLDLDDAKTWQNEQLAPHADSSRIIWERLLERAQQTAVADADDIRTIPDQTSTRVYETLAQKGWKDGHIHLALKMQIVDRKPISYTIQPMKYSSSRRAYRKFGSDRFITLGIPQPDYQKRLAEVHKFLSEPISICGRKYQIFFVKVAKDTCSAHYFATEGAGLEPWSRNALMQWLISLEKNKESPAAKLWSRISLSLSSTTASVVFAPHEIRLVEDITSPTDECMTDGCAKASPAVFRDIWRSGVLASKETPTAIQGRIGGAKGVWYIDPAADLNSDEKWVEIRPSQLKYKYDSSDEILRTLVFSVVYVH